MQKLLWNLKFQNFKCLLFWNLVCFQTFSPLISQLCSRGQKGREFSNWFSTFKVWTTLQCDTLWHLPEKRKTTSSWEDLQIATKPASQVMIIYSYICQTFKVVKITTSKISKNKIIWAHERNLWNSDMRPHWPTSRQYNQMIDQLFFYQYWAILTNFFLSILSTHFLFEVN